LVYAHTINAIIGIHNADSRKRSYIHCGFSVGSQNQLSESDVDVTSIINFCTAEKCIQMYTLERNSSKFKLTSPEPTPK